MIQHVIVVPLMVFVLLLSATAYVWHEIKQVQLSQEISDARDDLEFVSAHLAAHLDVRFVLAQLIRQEWIDAQTLNPADFAAIVRPKLQRFMDIQAINWLGPDGVIKWVNPLEGNEGAIGLDIRNHPVASRPLKDAERLKELRVTPPIDLAQGGRGFVVYLPVYELGQLKGFINMVFRISSLIEGALPAGSLQNYDLHITDGETPVFENHLGTHLATPASRQIGVGNRQWTISIAPTRAAGSEFSQASSNLFLLLGLIFTVALPLMLFQLMKRNAELRMTQRRLADWADISSDWFFETDENLRYTYFSPRFEEVTGVPPEQLLGKTRQEGGAPEAEPAELQAILRNMEDRLPYRDFEHSRTKPDGSKVFLSVSARPAYDDTGNFIGYRGIGRDITERKTSQKALNDALIASEHANRAKSEFLATMSHEFRTPLNAIIGFSEMLKEQYFGKLGDKNYVEYATDIHRSGRHMLDLVNDILDFSAIEASKRQMHPEAFSFQDVLSDGIRNVETQLRKKNLSLKQELDADLPPLYADKRSVYQIVLNLLSNAVKFTNPGGGVTITASSDGKVFSFCIADTGIGIAQDQLATITEPFSQSQADPHIAGSGTGLGLTIVKSLVEAHGGALEIESETGVGTRVTVRLSVTKK
ncbi:MAG: PAS domain S-box protein [Rhodospirillales bacterium]|nr:PAS domain S-box protein [Rhodospirillales bacterium]MBO6787100.1 PAS domain S-box protein [Rhodospirillales bacterium]